MTSSAQAKHSLISPHGADSTSSFHTEQRDSSNQKKVSAPKVTIFSPNKQRDIMETKKRQRPNPIPLPEPQKFRHDQTKFRDPVEKIYGHSRNTTNPVSKSEDKSSAPTIQTSSVISVPSTSATTKSPMQTKVNGSMNYSQARSSASDAALSMEKTVNYLSSTSEFIKPCSVVLRKLSESKITGKAVLAPNDKYSLAKNEKTAERSASRIVCADAPKTATHPTTSGKAPKDKISEKSFMMGFLSYLSSTSSKVTKSTQTSPKKSNTTSPSSSNQSLQSQSQWMSDSPRSLNWQTKSQTAHSQQVLRALSGAMNSFQTVASNSTPRPTDKNYSPATSSEARISATSTPTLSTPEAGAKTNPTTSTSLRRSLLESTTPNSNSHQRPFPSPSWLTHVLTTPSSAFNSASSLSSTNTTPRSPSERSVSSIIATESTPKTVANFMPATEFTPMLTPTRLRDRSAKKISYKE